MLLGSGRTLLILLRYNSLVSHLVLPFCVLLVVIYFGFDVNYFGPFI